jgi:hypothetical protein
MKRSSNSLGKEVSPATFGVILDLTKDLESQSEVKAQSLKREGIQVKTETLPLLGLLFNKRHQLAAKTLLAVIRGNPKIFDVQPIPHGGAVKTRDDLTLVPNKDPKIAYV